MRSLKLGSLFSGIGGIDLGFQRAGYDVRWQVEKDEWCRTIYSRADTGYGRRKRRLEMSETIKLIEHDKSTWGDGPWQTEPDRVQWNHAGFACLIVRNGWGVWCGYVGVPEEHPYYKVNYNDVPNLLVHGGLTYSDVCRGHICHIPEPGFPDKVWWLGFDCGHWNDYAPGIAPGVRHGEYRDLAYVTHEVEQLAEQLREVVSMDS